jgi:FkbM family methyltransferase
MMQANLDPCRGSPAHRIYVNGHELSACCCRLPVTDNSTVDIFVDAASQDAMTQSLVEQRHSVPAGYRLLAELAPPESFVLDLGAHIGTFTLYAAALGYRVAAVDANPTNLALLRASLERNQFQTVFPIQAAVSDHAGVLEFFPSGPYGVVANPAVVAPTIPVRAATVPALLEEIGWTRVDFIKLDIEGSEVHAVRGMADLLARSTAPPILFESNGFTLGLFDQTPNTLLSALEAFGYRCYLVEPGLLTPVRATDIQPACNVDYLAVKRPLRRVGAWRLGRPMSRHARCVRMMAELNKPYAEERIYLGQMLAQSDAALLGEPAIHALLARLQQDEDERVRAAVNWWDPTQHPPARRPIRLARRLWDALRSRLPWQ